MSKASSTFRRSRPESVASGARCLAAASLAAVSAVVWLAATCEPAFAQAAPESQEASGSSGSNVAKGIVGGGMLGAEAAMLAESAFRLRPTWMYLAGAGAGALAGGYLGYQISDGSSNKPPAFLLAGGIALIIPTIMGVLTATQYAPPDSRREPDEDEPADELPTDEQPTEDELPDEQSNLPVRFDLPNVGLAQAFSRDELVRFRVHQVTELHLSLLRGAF
jgi:MFS family permease